MDAIWEWRNLFTSYQNAITGRTCLVIWKISLQVVNYVKKTNKKVKTKPTVLQMTYTKINLEEHWNWSNRPLYKWIGRVLISTDDYRYVLTLIDYFSNYVEVFRLKGNKYLRSVVNCIINFVDKCSSWTGQWQRGWI